MNQIIMPKQMADELAQAAKRHCPADEKEAKEFMALVRLWTKELGLPE